MVRSMIPWTSGTLRSLDQPRWFGPGRLFEDLRRDMDRMMEEFLPAGDGGHQRDWFVPQVNIAQTDKEYEITLDLPGVKPEDVSVELKDDELTITGERKVESQHEGKSFQCTECQYGAFRRVIALDKAIKADQIHAEYKDGVLKLTVPKDESVQPKRIEVTHG